MSMMNARYMVLDVRSGIGESTAAHWTDLEILRKLNLAQNKAYKILAQTDGDWLIKKDRLTASSSVITLPSDCAKPAYLEDVSSETEIPILSSFRERRATRIDPGCPWVARSPGSSSPAARAVPREA